MYSDFLIQVLGFDKVSIIMQKAIITANTKHQIIFYNYYLMDYLIDVLSPKKRDKDSNSFVYDKGCNWYIENEDDIRAQMRIEEIKANVLRKNRHDYFK